MKENENQDKYDIAIVGGGPVGCSLALALSQLPLKIILLEANPIFSYSTTPPENDSRAYGLSAGSVSYLKKLNAWDESRIITTPIHHIHISHQGNFGVTRLNARDYNLSALGYVAAAPLLHHHLQKVCQTHANIKYSTPQKVVTVTTTPQQKAQLILADQTTLTAELCVIADGAHSLLRNQLNIQTETYDYQQSAIVTNIELSNFHHNWAYERFTNNGPAALLPRSPTTATLLWAVATKNVDPLLELSSDNFLPVIQNIFGYRLGRFKAIGTRTCFPLTKITAKSQIKSPYVILGNAAHSIHPVAALGLNLSLRDSATLAEVIAVNWQNGNNLADPISLEQYEKRRQADQNHIINFSDFLARIFTIPFLPISFTASMSRQLLDILPPLKNRLIKNSLHGVGPIANLWCGLPLMRE